MRDWRPFGIMRRRGWQRSGLGHHNHGCTLARAIESRKEGEKQVAIREQLFRSFRVG